MAHTITSESTLFQLDFGWIDFCFSMLLYCYLVMTKRKSFFVAGNIFGAITFFADYGFYYLLQRTRTIEYPGDSPPMTSVESLFFFLWFDWINTAALTMWALLCLEKTNMFVDCNTTSRDSHTKQHRLLDHLMLVCVPLWGCLTPWLSQNCSVDDRVIMTTRVSDKYKYYVIFVIFIPLLRVERQIAFRNIGKILLAGVVCGCVRHVPLLFWGMHTRDSHTESSSTSTATSSSTLVLVVTLLTEWPSLLCGVVYLLHRCTVSAPRPSGLTKREQAKGRSRRGVILTLLCLFAAICIPKDFWEALHPKHLEVHKLFYNLLPYMSAQSFQQIESTLLQTLTCHDLIAPRIRTLDVTCFDPSLDEEDNMDEVLRVLAASAQGGSELATQLALVVGRACGQCVGVGQRLFDSWPPPEESPPAYRSDLLLAMPYMPEWPAYAAAASGGVGEGEGVGEGGEPRARARPVQCVVITRHPLARLRSLYLHARNGGEKWFVDSGVEERLDLPMHESVSQFINEIGRDYLVQSHSYLMFNLEQGCLPIQYERLRVDFNNTMLTVFDYWNVLTEVQPRLLALLQSENPRQLRAEKGSKGGGVPQHVTSSKHSSLFISYVNGAIDSHDRGSVKALIAIQAEELHYENRQQ